MSYYLHTGAGNVGSYQISGIPYLTGSTVKGAEANYGEVTVSFPNITKSVTVINLSASNPILVHFETRANTKVVNNHHYVTLTNSGDSVSMDIRCTKLFVSAQNNSGTGSFEVIAELTSIVSTEFNFTGSLSGVGIDD